MNSTLKPGQIVRVVPCGQSRAQLVEVRTSGEHICTGLLVSRKYPGDYRGTAAFFTADVLAVVDADA